MRVEIEHLYQTFAQYPLSDPLSYCDCCFAPDDVARIVATPLRELGNPEITSLGADLVYTFGNERDFKHFLPRLVEVLVDDTFDLDPQFIFAKFEKIDYLAWPVDERRALERYFAVQFEAILNGPPISSGIWAIEELLCCASQAGVPMRSLLDNWRRRRDAFAARNLLYFWSLVKPFRPEYPEWLDYAWWKDTPGRNEIHAWLNEPETVMAWEAARGAFPGSDGL